MKYIRHNGRESGELELVRCLRLDAREWLFFGVFMRKEIILTAALGSMMWVAGCNRPTADAQDAKQASGPARPVNNGPINNAPISGPANRGTAASSAPSGRQIDTSVAGETSTGDQAEKNPAPAPGSNTSSSAGASSSDGRGWSGSSLSPAVSGKSPYANEKK